MEEVGGSLAKKIPADVSALQCLVFCLEKKVSSCVFYVRMVTLTSLICKSHSPDSFLTVTSVLFLSVLLFKVI